MASTRRRPQQQRAKLMVENILQASLKCIGERGFEHTTTRHIADTAGISVGTLYQYYKNKEEVFGALQTSLFDEFEAFGANQKDLLVMPFADAMRTLISRFVQGLSEDGGGRLVFARQLLHLDITEETQRAEKMLAELFTLFALRHPALAKVDDISTMIYVLFNAVIFNLLRYIERPLPDLDLEQFSDHMAQLTMGYIRSQLPPATDETFLGK